MTAERAWAVQGRSPTSDDDAVVDRVTAWPEDPALGSSPLRWARLVMAGVNVAVGDPAWQVDPLSLRLTEAWLTVLPGPPPERDRAPLRADQVAPGSPVRVEVTLRQVVALGALTGLRLGLEVRTEAGDPLAAAGVTVAGTGPGLVGRSRPGPPEGPGAPMARFPEEGPASEQEVVLGPEAVTDFSAWVSDPTPIHTDADAARAAGLRGPIAPGMFVLGVQAAAVSEAVRRSVIGIRARFVRPAVVGDRLIVSLRPAQRECMLVAVAGPEGPVVRRAWADLGPSGGTWPTDGFQ